MNGAKVEIWAMIVKRFFAFARQILKARPGGGIFRRTVNIRQAHQTGLPAGKLLFDQTIIPPLHANADLLLRKIHIWWSNCQYPLPAEFINARISTPRRALAEPVEASLKRQLSRSPPPKAELAFRRHWRF